MSFARHTSGTPASAVRACCHCQRRLLSISASLNSGHSKWASIKHDKGKNDAAKGKQRAIIAKEISDASRMYGPDPGFNPRLADAVSKAKRSSFPKASIETAIARGQGKSMNGQPLESLTIEAVVPPVAMIIEAQTESKGKALQELRTILKNAGAQATPTSYLFEKRGRIVFEKKEGVGVDEVLETALESGGLDVWEDEEGRIVVDTETSSLKSAGSQLVEVHGLKISSSEATWSPNEDTKVEGLEEEPLSQLSKLQDDLLDYPGVQAIYMNAALNAFQTNAAA